MVYLVVGALIIGLTLGLLGSGGSILTVPVLVYLLGHAEKAAIAESLAIVGGIALATSLPYARSHLIDWRSVVLFGIPGMAGAYLGAWLSSFVASEVQLTLFAVLMLVAAWTMAGRPRGSAVDAEQPAEAERTRHAAWKIVLEGLAVGAITGLVGVGGGFLIVPALVVLGGLPMRMAIGTSLAIIGLKSASGLYKYLDVLREVNESVDWLTVAAFVAVGFAGAVLGKRLATRLNQQALRRAFAGFLVVMGLFVLIKEAPGVWQRRQASPAEVSQVSGAQGRALLPNEDDCPPTRRSGKPPEPRAESAAAARGFRSQAGAVAEGDGGQGVDQGDPPQLLDGRFLVQRVGARGQRAVGDRRHPAAAVTSSRPPFPRGPSRWPRSAP